MVSKRRVDMCWRCNATPLKADDPGDFCPRCVQLNARDRRLAEAEQERLETERQIVKTLAAQLKMENMGRAADSINELIKHHIAGIGK